ncbi:hypothetical protein AN948_06585 [Rhodococcus sp. ADH]|nr:hypothetical protein AN948_06585 [Rhodococcus sp. ADH]RGP48085.1 hypothetical protein AWH04_28820 [Rhodococcus erythropolis]
MMRSSNPKKIVSTELRQLDRRCSPALTVRQLTQRGRSLRAQRNKLRTTETATIATPADRRMPRDKPTKGKCGESCIPIVEHVIRT